MAIYLGLLMFSFIVTCVAIVPFIDFLFARKITRKDERAQVEAGDTEAFRKLHDLHNKKVGTPIGGGILIIFIVSVLTAIMLPLLSRMGLYITSAFPLKDELNVIFFTFISFGILGLYDDLVKIFGFAKTGFFGLRMRHKLIIQFILSIMVALLLWFNLKIDILNIPFWGVIHLKIWYVPVATFLIMVFTNAFDFTDGVDGLSCGTLLICLLAFWVLSVSFLDTPLSIFIALWIGALIAFLYFNVYPARIWLGNAGGLAFGATLGVVGLLLGKPVAMLVIGGVFVAEGASSFLQIVWFRLFGKRLFPIAPIHHWLQVAGWPEPKIVMRAWLVSIVLAIFGLWLALL